MQGQLWSHNIFDLLSLSKPPVTRSERRHDKRNQRDGAMPGIYPVTDSWPIIPTLQNLHPKPLDDFHLSRYDFKQAHEQMLRNRFEQNSTNVQRDVSDMSQNEFL